MKQQESSTTLRQAQGKVDYLIIGQGISGTWLSYYLQKAGKSFLVIDNNGPAAPSRLAAGIINPVTGRRHAEVWMAGEIMPFAWDAYTELGIQLGIKTISRKDIIDFFPSPQMRLSFIKRVNENGEYVYLAESQGPFHQFFNYEFGYGEIKPAYTANLETLLPAWRKFLQHSNLLVEEEFDSSQLEVSAEYVIYKSITAQKIIYCDGNSSVVNPYFKYLPFAPNKGEALIVEIPGLPAANIFKKGLSLVPMDTAGQWWIGSSYAWEFDHEEPTNEFREKTEQLLKSWLKIPFTITKHLSGIRPATLERRPFVGLHPLYPVVGILNGMGSKGCSLSPFFAKQLTDNLLYAKPICPEADISRFRNMLSR